MRPFVTIHSSDIESEIKHGNPAASASNKATLKPSYKEIERHPWLVTVRAHFLEYP